MTSAGRKPWCQQCKPSSPDCSYICKSVNFCFFVPVLACLLGQLFLQSFPTSPQGAVLTQEIPPGLAHGSQGWRREGVGVGLGVLFERQQTNPGSKTGRQSDIAGERSG